MRPIPFPLRKASPLRRPPPDARAALRRLMALLVAVAVAAAAAAPAMAAQTIVVPRVMPRRSPEALRGVEADIVAAINRERATRGIAALAVHPRLADTALRHSRDMALRRQLGHVGPDGKRVADRVDDPLHGPPLPWKAVAENVAANNFDDPVDTAVRGWLASPGHRRALLDPRYAWTGVGAAQDAEGKYYFTQVFVQPNPDPARARAWELAAAAAIVAVAADAPGSSVAPVAVSAPAPVPVGSPPSASRAAGARGASARTGSSASSGSSGAADAGGGWTPSRGGGRGNIGVFWEEPPAEALAAALRELEGEVRERLDSQRIRRGLDPLWPHARLEAVARRHSRDQAARGAAGHFGSDGSTPRERLLRSGDGPGPMPVWSRLGEIVAVNNNADPVDAAVRGWLDSPGHRDHLLEPAYTHVGVGIARDAKGIYYITALFMREAPGQP